MIIPNQRIKIWSIGWRYLIVLDACRYDYFEKVYKDYPILKDGKLEKVLSPGSNTIEWITYTFRGVQCYDIVYISANPYINSKGVSFGKFNPKDLHFYRIIDVWEWGWDSKLGTVHPREVNKAALLAMKLYPNKRFIIHYIQPHFPYLSIPREKQIERGNKIKKFIYWKILNSQIRCMLKFIGRFFAPPNEVALVAEKVGIDKLRWAYEENLKIVLEYVVKLLKIIKGKCVVTSDHGELLGEHGKYGHDIYGQPYKVKPPELIEVPWLELEI